MTDDYRRVRREFFETLAKLEPADAVVLDLLVAEGKGSRDSIALLDLSETDAVVSAQCLKRSEVHSTRERFRSKRLDCSPVGLRLSAFVAACSPPGAESRPTRPATPP